MMWGNNWMNGWMGNYPEILWLIGPLALLDLILKGLALWRAGRNGHKWWFIAILIINSAGIVPGIYLLTNKDLPAQAGKKTSKKK